MIAPNRTLALALTFFLGATVPALAATEISFSISGMDPVEVMRYNEDGKTRLGYVQSTNFSHSVAEKRGKAEKVEDGILYYSVMLEKLPDGTYQMDISYDFSSADGTSKGIRNRSIVNEDILKGIGDAEIAAQAGKHADALAGVVWQNFLKSKITAAEEEVVKSLREFLTGISEDLLKSMPKDALNIIRRWEDLAGKA